MYTYKHRNVMVATPAAAKGTRNGPMTEENSAGKLDISAVYSTLCPMISAFAKLHFL